MITNRIESDLYVTRHLTELRDELLPEKFENCLYICALLSALLLLLLKNHYDYDLLLLFSINNLPINIPNSFYYTIT